MNVRVVLYTILDGVLSCTRPLKTKKKKIKPRNYLVPIMRLGRKAVAFVDRKKEELKRRCRKRVSETED